MPAFIDTTSGLYCCDCADPHYLMDSRWDENGEYTPTCPNCGEFVKPKADKDRLVVPGLRKKVATVRNPTPQRPTPTPPKPPKTAPDG